MGFKFRLLILLLFSTLVLLLSCGKPTSADVVVFNGKIFTAQSENSFVSALAISDGVVAAAGDDSLILNRFSTQSPALDLGGRLVVPGFHDAHLHFWNGAKIKQQLDLRNTESLQRTIEKIAAKVEAIEPGNWVIGRGWDHELWASRELPTKGLLDQISTAHYIYLKRVDGHAAWVNSPVLELLGYSADATDPPGGRIMRYPESNEPNGILFDKAYEVLDDIIPDPTFEEKYEWVREAGDFANSLGITSITDNSPAEMYPVYVDLHKNDQLHLRVNFWIEYDEDLDSLKEYVSAYGSIPRFLDARLIKLYADGSLGSRTAYLQQPYEDDPGNRGLPQYPFEQLLQMARHVVKSDLRVAIHAIGDAGVKQVLDVYGILTEEFPGQDHRFRVEHAQMLDPADFSRFHELGVIASMQPSHCITDMHWAKRRIGERARYAYAWRTFLENEVALAFGTDWPVEPLNPMVGLYAAVTRQDTSGYPKDGWYPEERITLAQAIIAYTHGSAYAAGNEEWCGTLEPGKAADFVILDRDIFAAPVQEILSTSVLETYLGGQKVFDRTTP